MFGKTIRTLKEGRKNADCDAGIHSDKYACKIVNLQVVSEEKMELGNVMSALHRSTVPKHSYLTPVSVMHNKKERMPTLFFDRKQTLRESMLLNDFGNFQ
jgi:hypothetical protein